MEFKMSVSEIVNTPRIINSTGMSFSKNLPNSNTLSLMVFVTFTVFELKKVLRAVDNGV